MIIQGNAGRQHVPLGVRGGDGGGFPPSDCIPYPCRGALALDCPSCLESHQGLAGLLDITWRTGMIKESSRSRDE